MGFLSALVLAMGIALYGELTATTARIAGEARTDNVDRLLTGMNDRATSKREKARNNAQALKTVAEDHTASDVNLTPFVLCYALSGLVTLVASAVQPSGRKAARPTASGGSGGDQIPANPMIEETARRIGFVPVSATHVRAYLNSRGTGYNIYDGRNYLGHLPLAVIS